MRSWPRPRLMLVAVIATVVVVTGLKRLGSWRATPTGGETSTAAQPTEPSRRSQQQRESAAEQPQPWLGGSEFQAITAQGHERDAVEKDRGPRRQNGPTVDRRANNEPQPQPLEVAQVSAEIPAAQLGLVRSHSPLDRSPQAEKPTEMPDVGTAVPGVSFEAQQSAGASDAADVMPAQPGPYGGQPAHTLTSVYLTRSNDSFWSISEQLYGSGVFYMALYFHNRDRVQLPDRIPAGLPLEAPPLAELRRLFPQHCPRESEQSGGWGPAR